MVSNFLDFTCMPIVYHVSVGKAPFKNELIVPGTRFFKMHLSFFLKKKKCYRQIFGYKLSLFLIYIRTQCEIANWKHCT